MVVETKLDEAVVAPAHQPGLASMVSIPASPVLVAVTVSLSLTARVLKEKEFSSQARYYE